MAHLVQLIDPSANLPDSKGGLSCAPDVTRVFGWADINESGLVRGWATPEDSHTWNNGTDAELDLAVQQVSGAMTMTITGHPFVKPKHPHQSITIYANGYRLGFWRLKTEEVAYLTVVVQPEHWFRRGGHFVLNVVFSMPDSIVPSELGIGLDMREIGFCFNSIKLSPAS
jgi:hypothetical protein